MSCRMNTELLYFLCSSPDHAKPSHPPPPQVITLDTAGANYRSVWAMHKHFPEVKTFVRAFDIENGAQEKGGGGGGGSGGERWW